jgi:uncharacterized protein YebE (UPF0316 family)
VNPLFGFPTFESPTLLALAIFAAELCVVTMGTIRIVFVARGMKRLAPAIGFFEITIWLFAISQIMQNLTNVSCYVAFAGGFTAGSYLGIWIPEKLALGTLVVRIITRRDPTPLIESLTAANYGVTSIGGQGTTGPVQIVFTVIKRKELPNVATIIKAFDSKAFYSVDELHTAAQGIFPGGRPRANGFTTGSTGMIRVDNEVTPALLRTRTAEQRSAESAPLAKSA